MAPLFICEMICLTCMIRIKWNWNQRTFPSIKLFFPFQATNCPNFFFFFLTRDNSVEQTALFHEWRFFYCLSCATSTKKRNLN